MAFEINYEKLIEMEKLDNVTHCNSDLFIDKSTLIKVSENNVNKMIEYLMTIPPHPHVIKPQEQGKIIYGTKNAYTPIYKSAYKMPFLPDAKPLSFLAQFRHIPYEKKLEYIKELFSALEFLHHYIVLGDIHANNLIVSNGKAYIIDLDDARKKGYFKIIDCAYFIKPFEFMSTSIYTDLVKMYLESLAFILEIGFHKYINDFGFSYFLNILSSCHFPKEVMNFLNLWKHPYRLKSLGKDAYCFEKFMSPNILENEKELKLILQNL